MTTTPTLWKLQSQVNTADEPVPDSSGFNLQAYSRVTALAGGGYVVAWTDSSRTHNPGGDAVVAQRYDAFGEKVGGEIKVSPFNSGQQRMTSMAGLPDGGFLVAYSDFIGGFTDSYVRKFDAAGNAVRIDVIDNTTAQVGGAQITTFADGSYLAVTLAATSTSDVDVVGRRVSADGVVGAQFDILSENGNPKGEVSLATLSNGNVAIVFGRGQDALNLVDVLFAVLSPTGVPIVSPVFVAGAFDTVREEDADVAALKGGGFVVVWTDNGGDGDLSGVRATIYTNSGAPGPRVNFLVNTAETGSQYGASVIPLADGGFLVTWKDRAQFYHLAQRFDGGGAKVGDVLPVKAWGDGGENSGFTVIDTALLSDGRFAYSIGDTTTGDIDVVTSVWDPRTSPINGTGIGEVMVSRLEGATVNGLGGDDTLFGMGNADTLDGGPGHDALDGRLGADRMIGGPGNDTYVVDNPGDQVIEADGGGFDIVTSVVSFSLGGQFAEELRLVDAGNTNATGNALANRLFGNAGANQLDGRAGADFMDGGAGGDTYIVDDAGDRVNDSGTDGATDVIRSSVPYSLVDTKAEQLILTGSGASAAIGNGMANLLIGTAAANRLDGLGGADRMEGAGGDDTYVVDNAGDIVRDGGIGNGIDTVLASVSYSLVNTDADSVTLAGAAGINATGNSLANFLTGNAAANRLDGLGGADRMEGAAGNDVYVVDNAADVVRDGNVGNGLDTVLASVSFSLVDTHADNLTLTGNNPANATGNSQVNLLTGNAAANRLDGLGGGDRMEGFAGDDFYVVDTIGDVVRDGGVGNGVDTVLASVGYSLLDTHADNLTLTGNSSTHATGNALANVLRGNAGANRITGAGGVDDLFAGVDIVRDVFVFAAGDSGNAAATMDQIFEFRRSTGSADTTSDRIDLSQIDADPDAGDQAFRFVSNFTAPTGNQANGQVRVVADGANRNVEIDLDGNNSVDMLIQVVNIAVLTQADLIL